MWGRGDKGDKGTRGQGDKGTRGQGSKMLPLFIFIVIATTGTDTPLSQRISFIVLLELVAPEAPEASEACDEQELKINNL